MFSFNKKKNWHRVCRDFFFLSIFSLKIFFFYFRLHIPKKWTKRCCSLHRNIRKWWNFWFIKNSWKTIQIYSWTRRGNPWMGWGCTTNVCWTKSQVNLLTRLCLWKSWTSRCYSTKCYLDLWRWTYQSRIKELFSMPFSKKHNLIKCFFFLTTFFFN